MCYIHKCVILIVMSVACVATAPTDPRVYSETARLMNAVRRHMRDDMDPDLDYFFNDDGSADEEIPKTHRGHKKQQVERDQDEDNLLDVFQLLQKNYEAKLKNELMQKKRERFYYGTNPEVWQHVQKRPMKRPEFPYSGNIHQAYGEFEDLTRDAAIRHPRNS